MRYLYFLIFLFNSIPGYTQEKAYNIDTIRVTSHILEENRNILIYSSLDFSAADSVHFIYLLDGEYSVFRYNQVFERFKDSLQHIIAVGIVNTDRKRDLLYVKGAGKFLDFIASELIPEVERGYQISRRALFGHSFGGSFTVYSLIQKPGLFDYYIASSPTPLMDLVNTDSYLKIDRDSNRRIFFSFSSGSYDMGQVRKWSTKLKENLASVEFQHLNWKCEEFEGKNHSNSDIPALVKAVQELK